jgi:L-aminopeptidase/D-esterase-like protein
MHNAITDVPGIKVGHYTDPVAATGCTVILCENGAVAGVDVRGAAPGTRETDLLRPMHLVEKIHAVILSGGSAFGLDAASGVMKYLEEQKVGIDTAGGKIPIVAAAVLYDLFIGNPKVRPGASEGYQACKAAISGDVTEGCVGAGTGTMVGQLMGTERAIKSGLGTARERLADGLVIAAIIAVNALGDIIDQETGSVMAGVRNTDGNGYSNAMSLIRNGKQYKIQPGTNTTIGVVATNARLNKEGINKVAQMAHDGMARAINPAHTMYDGDTIFALSYGDKDADVTNVGVIAAEVVQKAIIRAVTLATPLASIPSMNTYNHTGKDTE